MMDLPGLLTQDNIEHRGAIIRRQGEAANTIMLLQSGRVAIVCNRDALEPGEDEIQTKGIRICLLDQPGTLFATNGLFMSEHIFSYIVLEDNTRFLELTPEKSWSETLESTPSLGIGLCHSLAVRLFGMARHLRQAIYFDETLRRTHEHFMRECVQILGQSEAVLKKRVYLEMTEGLRHLDRSLSTLRTRMVAPHQLNITPLIRKATSTNSARAALSGAPQISLETGELLLDESMEAHALYLVIAGQLEVCVAGEAVDRLQPDDFVGEMSLLAPEAETQYLTVRALEPCKLYRVCRSPEEFHEIATDRPAAAASLARTLGGRLATFGYAMALKCHRLRDAIGAIGNTQESTSCASMFRDLADLLAPYESTQALSAQARLAENRSLEIAARLEDEFYNKVIAQASTTGIQHRGVG